MPVVNANIVVRRRLIHVKREARRLNSHVIESVSNHQNISVTDHLIDLAGVAHLILPHLLNEASILELPMIRANVDSLHA